MNPNNQNGSKSEWVVLGDEAVSVRSVLSPHPAATNVVVVKVTPHSELSLFGLTPVPRRLDFYLRSIHLVHIVPISEGSKLCIRTIGSLAHVITSSKAIDLKAADGVSKCKDSSGPAFVKGLVGDIVLTEVGVKVIKGTVEGLVVEDAQYR